jgi:hypothetical protein
MAKKSKAVKSKKASKAKQPEAPTPRYMRGKKPTRIAAHSIADVLAVIEKHGHGKKFKRQAKAAGHTVTLNPKTVNFVKDFLAKNGMHTNRIAANVINSNGSFNCG